MKDFIQCNKYTIIVFSSYKSRSTPDGYVCIKIGNFPYTRAGSPESCLFFYLILVKFIFTLVYHHFIFHHLKFSKEHKRPSGDHFLKFVGSGQYISRPETRRCFIQSLGVMKELRMLALEYSHIADGTGGALISLLPVLKRPNFRLQLICRENHVPGRTNAALGVGGYNIPDTAWRRVSIACPDLYLFMAFDRIWDNDNVRRFLSPSIPLCETHLHIGIHVKLVERKDSDLSCFVRHLAFNYASTLSTLGIHQWRSAIFPLRRIFELMPRLVRFYYLGNVDETDLHKTLNLVACGVCTKLKKISIQIQPEQSMTDHWNKMVLKVIEDYSEIMRLNGIDFCMQIYKH